MSLYHKQKVTKYNNYFNISRDIQCSVMLQSSGVVIMLLDWTVLNRGSVWGVGGREGGRDCQQVVS